MLSYYTFRRIVPESADWERIEAASDSTVFHTRNWDDYVRRMGRKPLVVEVLAQGKPAGYFIGARMWAGIRIVMAPMMGMGTYSQGLCMLEPVTRSERIGIYLQLVDWFYATRLADYVQVCDWQMHTDLEDGPRGWKDPDLDAAGIHYNARATYYLDTRKSEEELWSGLQYKSCKYPINKARKNGLRVTFVDHEEDIDAFVDRHYEHIRDMLARKNSRGLACQRKENISALCHALYPDKGLLAQVIGPDENGRELSMASGIFAAGKAGSSFFTAGSYKRYMNQSPNELLVWEAVRRLHGEGAGDLIFGGTAHYKKKFNPQLAVIPVMVFSRFRFLTTLYARFKRLYARWVTKSKQA